MPRFTDLTADETSDLWLTAQKVGSRIETFHNASSLTLAIQVTKALLYLLFNSFLMMCDCEMIWIGMVAMKRCRMALRRDRVFHMYTFTSCLVKVVTLRRMMRSMMQ